MAGGGAPCCSASVGAAPRVWRASAAGGGGAAAPVAAAASPAPLGHRWRNGHDMEAGRGAADAGAVSCKRQQLAELTGDDDRSAMKVRRLLECSEVDRQKFGAAAS